MMIGYARVTTKDQNTLLQKDAPKSARAEWIFIEKVTGRNVDRPELKRMIDSLRNGDTMIIWKLERLGQSIKDLNHSMRSLKDSVLSLSFFSTTSIRVMCWESLSLIFFFSGRV